MRAFRLGAAIVTLLAAAPLARAQDSPPPPQQKQESKMQIEDTETIATFLKRLEGKPVRLRLAGGGDEIAGKLVKVGANLAYLSELSGREFFDAVIRIDQIAAVVLQVRSR
jgi:hypothetical protein